MNENKDGRLNACVNNAPAADESVHETPLNDASETENTENTGNAENAEKKSERPLSMRRRLKAYAAEGGERVKPRLSLSDIWTYYKWHILIAVFFIAIFAVLITQAVTKEKFDVKVLYAGPAILTDDERNAVCEALSQQIDSDYNGDGKKNAELFDLILMSNEELSEMYNQGVSDYFLNPSTVKDNRETLSVNAVAGEYVIFMIDVDYYGSLYESGVFLTLDSLGVTSGTRYDDCSVYLSSLDIAKFYTAFSVFPDDTLVCVKRLSVNAKEKTALLWEENKRYFKIFTDFRLPEGFTPEGK